MAPTSPKSRAARAKEPRGVWKTASLFAHGLALVLGASAACGDGGGSDDGDQWISTGQTTALTEGGQDESSSGSATTGSSATGSSTTGSSTTSTDTTSESGDPSGSTTTSESGDPSGSTTSSDSGDSSTSTTGGDDPPPLGDACQGYATRYWDCCKPHCGWEANVPVGSSPANTCNEANQSHGGNWDVPNACQVPSFDAGYTCFNTRPWAVSNSLAYGFAAVPASGDVCGRCYQLEFTGSGHNTADDPGSVALQGKTMIVQAVNVGFDVGGGQFDIQIPGGGVGAFDACSSQWNVNSNELGATYGGFMTACQQQNGDDWNQNKQCVLDRCYAVFDESGHADLLAGCEWYVNWFEAADNPNLDYQEVLCPQSLIDISGMERPTDDLQDCGGGGDCTQEQMDMCDCSWTNGGQNCGEDDGSCCWQACCG